AVAVAATGPVRQQIVDVVSSRPVVFVAPRPAAATPRASAPPSASSVRVPAMDLPTIEAPNLPVMTPSSSEPLFGAGPVSMRAAVGAVGGSRTDPASVISADAVEQAVTPRAGN